MVLAFTQFQFQMIEWPADLTNYHQSRAQQVLAHGNGVFCSTKHCVTAALSGHRVAFATWWASACSPGL